MGGVQRTIGCAAAAERGRDDQDGAAGAAHAESAADGSLLVRLRTLQSGTRYPVVVRFETQNYAGVTTNNYALDEVVDAK